MVVFVFNSPPTYARCNCFRAGDAETCCLLFACHLHCHNLRESCFVRKRIEMMALRSRGSGKDRGKDPESPNAQGGVLSQLIPQLEVWKFAFFLQKMRVTQTFPSQFKALKSLYSILYQLLFHGIHDVQANRAQCFPPCDVHPCLCPGVSDADADPLHSPTFWGQLEPASPVEAGTIYIPWLLLAFGF